MTLVSDQVVFQAPEVDYSDFPLPVIVDDAEDVMGPQSAATAPTPMHIHSEGLAAPSIATPAVRSSGYPSWLTRDPSDYRPILTSGKRL